jgi:hypothetical protein
MRVLVLFALAGLPLAGCAAFPGPQAAQDRATLQECRADADRVYAAQNRYQLSEQSTRDTPFSGSGQPVTPSDGLADEYAHANRVDDCVRHGGVVDTSPEPTPAPAPAPAHAP